MLPKSLFSILSIIIGQYLLSVHSFSPISFRSLSSTRTTSSPLFISNPQNGNNGEIEITRRNILNSILPSVIATQALLISSPTPPAYASGGATAGGAYLLSAKQRYNERVTAGVKSFVALSQSIEGGDLSKATVYFTSEDVGSWKDFAAAGYLLSNAFRRSSSTAPDALPSVQKWKAFAAQGEAMQKAIKKKSKSGVQKAYTEATSLLDAYLEAVELPPAMEL